MKRAYRAIAILISFVLIFPISAYAEDLAALERSITSYLNKGMTIAEIADAFYDPSDWEDIGTNSLRLYAELYRRELQRRDYAYNDVVIHAGTYLVGKDIPAGTYTITANDIGFIYIRTNDRSGQELDSFFLYTEYGEKNMDRIGKLNLNEGESLYISSGSVVFSPYTGIGY